MARPSKTKQFAIYEDNLPPAAGNIPAESASDDGQDMASDVDNKQLARLSESSVLVHEEDGEETTCIAAAADTGDTDADDERRESTLTATSVSSLPESSFETDYERGIMHKPYTPPMIRPSFRRPESVRRMQMSSPTPSERSLRRVMLSPQRPTPRSAKSSVKGSPRPRRSEVEEEPKEYPLVLLHVTLLPVELRWSQQSVQDILPPTTLENLQLLRSKASEIIIQRGILIPHPRGDYELLEERLLEALELKKERITKCGHFRSRDSTVSSSSGDSGMGSSLEGLSENEICETCSRRLKTSTAVVSAGGRKWSIKVFAANGLMKASAWSAAWSEMERVDVEILPWIGDELRRKLDETREEEDAQERSREEDEEARIRVVVEEQVRIAHEERTRAEEVLRARAAQSNTTPADSPAKTASSTKYDDLPPVYRPKDIPLSLLLKNYICLLAQDRRNLAIFVLALAAFWLSLRAAVAPGPSDVSVLPPSWENIQYEPPVLQVDSSVSGSEAEKTIDIAQAVSTQSDTRELLKPTVSATTEQTEETVNYPGDDLDAGPDRERDSVVMEAGEECRNMASTRHLFAQAAQTLLNG